MNDLSQYLLDTGKKIHILYSNLPAIYATNFWLLFGQTHLKGINTINLRRSIPPNVRKLYVAYKLAFIPSYTTILFLPLHAKFWWLSALTALPSRTSVFS